MSFTSLYFIIPKKTQVVLTIKLFMEFDQYTLDPGGRIELFLICIAYIHIYINCPYPLYIASIACISGQVALFLPILSFLPDLELWTLLQFPPFSPNSKANNENCFIQYLNATFFYFPLYSLTVRELGFAKLLGIPFIPITTGIPSFRFCSHQNSVPRCLLFLPTTLAKWLEKFDKMNINTLPQLLLSCHRVVPRKLRRKAKKKIFVNNWVENFSLRKYWVLPVFWIEKLL